MPKKKLIRMNGIFEACLCLILVRLVFQPTHSKHPLNTKGVTMRGIFSNPAK